MARSAPARKPDPVSALLALRMQARGFSRGWSVSPYRGRARLRVTAGAGDGKQRQVLMGWPWSAAHAEDIAAAAVAAREAFVAGTPLDQALQLHVSSLRAIKSLSLRRSSQTCSRLASRMTRKV